MYKIEKDIKSPEGQSMTKLIRLMEIGDSFVCELAKRSGVMCLFRQVGFKCTTKKISDTEARVWRIE